MPQLHMVGVVKWENGMLPATIFLLVIINKYITNVCLSLRQWDYTASF